MDTSDIIRLACDAGASAAGVAELCEVEPYAVEMYDRWTAEGRHGDMTYLERYADVRRDPRLLLDGARSIIVTAFSYLTPGLYSDGGLRWARYSLGRDYHEEVRERLSSVAGAITAATGAQCRVTVDTAPLRERYWAVKAGIGFIGINNQLIVPSAGSWCVLGEIVTTLRLDPSEACADSCDGCMRCVRACPGHALDGRGGMDARRCMSYLSIEYRGEEVPDFGDRIYGCDICQEVCPHNAGAPATSIENFRPRREILSLTRENIAAMEQSDFSRIFSHSAIKRTKLAGLKRNIGKNKGK